MRRKQERRWRTLENMTTTSKNTTSRSTRLLSPPRRFLVGTVAVAAGFWWVEALVSGPPRIAAFEGSSTAPVPSATGAAISDYTWCLADAGSLGISDPLRACSHLRRPALVGDPISLGLPVQ